ncbi:hypothetical protein IG631_10203 [Alternaria alternata]|jgi:hypothetical protein|nr:hypothetical protein IG631_10203 [Alternaria alternata]
MTKLGQPIAGVPRQLSPFQSERGWPAVLQCLSLLFRLSEHYQASRSDSQQCKSSRQPGHSAPPADCA